jgi:hypothetical protein
LGDDAHRRRRVILIEQAKAAARRVAFIEPGKSVEDIARANPRNADVREWRRLKKALMEWAFEPRRRRP